jgi:hypothetical protein
MGQRPTIRCLPAEPKVTYIPQSLRTIIAALFLLLVHSAEAQVAESGYSLPLSLALEAATEAIGSCEAHEHALSALVVDASGVVKVQLKGDPSTVHTQEYQLSQSLYARHFWTDLQPEHDEPNR